MNERLLFQKEIEAAVRKADKALKEGDFATVEDATAQQSAYVELAREVERAKKEIFKRHGVPELTSEEIEVFSAEARNEIVKELEEMQDVPFGEAVKFFRQKAGLSQREFGERLGVSPNAVGNLENRKQRKYMPRTIINTIAGFGWEPDDPRSKFLREKAGIGIGGVKTPKPR